MFGILCAPHEAAVVSCQWWIKAAATASLQRRLCPSLCIPLGPMNDPHKSDDCAKLTSLVASTFSQVLALFVPVLLSLAGDKLVVLWSRLKFLRIGPRGLLLSSCSVCLAQEQDDT